MIPVVSSFLNVTVITLDVIPMHRPIHHARLLASRCMHHTCSSQLDRATYDQTGALQAAALKETTRDHRRNKTASNPAPSTTHVLTRCAAAALLQPCRIPKSQYVCQAICRPELFGPTRHILQRLLQRLNAQLTPKRASMQIYAVASVRQQQPCTETPAAAPITPD
jgi:hypothetical protein